MSFVRIDSVLEDALTPLGATFEQPACVGQDFQTRQAVARNYATYQALVDKGVRSWMRGDPYEICDWSRVFTPIESAVWSAIRDEGLPMWPQFPVGRLSLDFGNPIIKIALECDGKDYHAAIDDAERNLFLRDLGWTVYRIPGWACLEERYTDEGRRIDNRLNHAMRAIQQAVALN